MIEDAPDGTITSEDFDRALEQTAARQGLREVPPPDDQYELLVDAAVSDLILSRWVLGEAEERGIEVTDREVEEEPVTVINQQFDPATRSRSSSTNPASRRRRRTSVPLQAGLRPDPAGGPAAGAGDHRGPAPARTTTRTSPSSSSPRRATSA